MQLEHANLTVASIEEALRFLQASFPHFHARGGGDIHGDPALGEWIHFGDETTYLALQQNCEHSAKRDQPYVSDGVNHLGFVVDSVDEVVARLATAGYSPSDASAATGHLHRRRIYFVDGNGCEWEFVEYTSSVDAERNSYETG